MVFISPGNRRFSCLVVVALSMVALAISMVCMTPNLQQPDLSIHCVLWSIESCNVASRKNTMTLTASEGGHESLRLGIPLLVVLEVFTSSNEGP